MDARLKLRGLMLTRSWEAILEGALILIAVVTAQVGLVALTAKGYGVMESTSTPFIPFQLHCMGSSVVLVVYPPLEIFQLQA